MNDVISNGFERWLAAPPGRLAGAGLDWLDDQRRVARERVREQGVPTSKTEDWRYTSLKGLLEQGFAQVDEAITALQPDDLEEILIPGLDSHRVVLVNGRYAPELSVLGDLPKGVRLGGLRALLDADPDALRDHLNRIADARQPLFLALNTAGLDDGFVALFDRAVMLERPIELIHLSVGLDEPRVAQPRHLIVLGDGAQATLIERYVSLGESLYCTNSVLEISLGRDAVLQHDRIQMESANAFHLTGLYLGQDANSRYRGVNIGLGARWARTELVTRFCGEQAECDLQGLYLAGDRQLMDYHLDVAHSVPRCTSRENFKGILYGKGRAVFDGLVSVARDAQKSDAAMSNRNLMLSESAEVDTKPRLEINADDVKCSHGTTVGRIEPEMLFYLRSRGISAPLARRMLCLGFAGEIIQTLSAEALREHVSERVGQRLESAPLN
ncbi:Fe-S cluster assembly protein SufD [Thiocystis violascens]|uniref:Iron-regulated ABC transporter permease protein SufD n=1 Tax=Thiocystis violascens (strain ATCC 17096 / DSM 198 / 6111) TaxID=765911 RepID=I3Y7Z8_THIV6|nr:Fe-S cluster assembly protein SufD [Thiocystis violascens]AFL73116.1 Iron-regulated ABC transporter permease protein SufD [Thiocystis violascens DSM 198]